MARLSRKGALVAGVALLALLPAPGFAQTQREAELEERLRTLEAAVAELRTELQAARTAAPPPQASAVQAAAAPAQDGFRVGATTIKLGGFFKANAAVSDYSGGDLPVGSLGRDFYLPQTIPVGGSGEGRDFDSHAKQTRIWLTTATPLNGHLVKGHLEFDFQTAPGTQGTERTTNGYNLALRRGFITYDDTLLIGQEWTNFQYVAALPESTDFVGPTEGTVFVRQMQARYTQKLGKELTLSVSAENPETATISPTSAALVENDDDHLPDVTARLNFAPSFGEFSLAGVLRQLSVDNGDEHARATGWGLSLAGKIPFGPDKRHDLRFMISGGDGIGHYLGLNFAPDAVLTPGMAGDLGTVKVLAGFAALRVGWTDRIRSTFMGSFQEVDYPGLSIPGGANESAWSAAANLFYSPVKNFDLGIEYRHGVRELVNGQTGKLDRVEAAAKYSF